MEIDYTNIIIILIGLVFILLGVGNIRNKKENKVKSKDIKKQTKKRVRKNPLSN